MNKDFFIPLWADFFHSSIIEEELHVRMVFLFLGATSDAEGFCRYTTKALARQANITIEQAEDALRVLQLPDPDSTNKDENGIRVKNVGPNQWWVVNKKYYRQRFQEMRSNDLAAERMRKKRERDGALPTVTERNEPEQTVTDSNPLDVHVDIDVPVDIDVRKNSIPFEEFYKLYPKHVAGTKAGTAWRNLTIKKQQAAMAALPAHIESWKGKDPKFIPHPTTWINQERWEDELSTKPVDNEWIYDTYLRTDMIDHSNSTLWEEYIEDAATHSPRAAPTFGEWLDAQN